MSGAVAAKGQATFESSGEVGGYITRFETEKKMAFEMRWRSIFGRMSRQIQSKTVAGQAKNC